ncbi:MAG: RNA polymerase sigma factor [Pyrinomonadaceae bacterium]
MLVEKPASSGSAELAQERLLIEAAQEDPHRFAELYEKNFNLVYAYIARRVSNREAAEDLTSEVFQKAFEHLPRFVWRGVPFAAWLLRIATNIIADRSKQAAREHELADHEDAAEISHFNLEEVEQRARLYRLVDQLPADQRRVITLRFAAEKSIREIVTELGRSEGAVKQLQFRGLQSLRAEFQAEKNG